MRENQEDDVVGGQSGRCSRNMIVRAVDGGVHGLWS